jgi:hypothetical protein
MGGVPSHRVCAHAFQYVRIANSILYMTGRPRCIPRPESRAGNCTTRADWGCALFYEAERANTHPVYSLIGCLAYWSKQSK